MYTGIGSLIITGIDLVLRLRTLLKRNLFQKWAKCMGIK